MRNEIIVEIRKTEIVVNKDLSVNTNEKYQFYFSNSIEQVAGLVSGNQGNKSVIKEIKNILKNQKFNEKYSLTFENVFDRFKDENILKKYVFIKYDFEVIGNKVNQKQKDESVIERNKQHRLQQKQNGTQIREDRRKKLVDNVDKLGVKIGDVTVLPIITQKSSVPAYIIDDIKKDGQKYIIELLLDTLCHQQFLYKKDGVIWLYHNHHRYNVNDFIKGIHIKKQLAIDKFMLTKLNNLTIDDCSCKINEFIKKL